MTVDSVGRLRRPDEDIAAGRGLEWLQDLDIFGSVQTDRPSCPTGPPCKSQGQTGGPPTLASDHHVAPVANDSPMITSLDEAQTAGPAGAMGNHRTALGKLGLKLRARADTPALLKGLLYGPDGAAFSPTHTRKKGKLYRYYVSQTVLKHGAGSCPVGRVPAGEIETAVIDQLRAVFRQPEIVAGT